MAGNAILTAEPSNGVINPASTAIRSTICLPVEVTGAEGVWQIAGTLVVVRGAVFEGTISLTLRVSSSGMISSGKVFLHYEIPASAVKASDPAISGLSGELPGRVGSGPVEKFIKDRSCNQDHKYRWM